MAGERNEELLASVRQSIGENTLEVRVDGGVETLRRRSDGGFDLSTPRAKYSARRVVLATGQRGNPRRLGVAGEDREEVYHRLYSPKHYANEDILVVGGGNSAIEAALTLSEQNRVTLSYRGFQFTRLFNYNLSQLGPDINNSKHTVYC